MCIYCVYMYMRTYVFMGVYRDIYTYRIMRIPSSPLYMWSVPWVRDKLTVPPVLASRS